MQADNILDRLISEYGETILRTFIPVKRRG